MLTLLSSSTHSAFYIVYTALVYACIATLAVLVIVFGRRARRNVKKETVSVLPDGFSPLDVKRIFIGKTYPRRLTRALIVHWANRGYIKVIRVSRYSVRIIKLSDMPPHDAPDAVFYDRGTYVRELELFKQFVRDIRRNNVVDIRRPLFTKTAVKNINNEFAVREDDGVYSAKHYTLKLISIFISLVPFVLTTVWIGLDTGNFMAIIFIFTAIIGLAVLMFVKDMPIPFKLIWCGIWLGVSLGATITFASATGDVLGTAYVAAALLLIGPLLIIRFIDYREKNNLRDYSDLVNYRKFLLFADKRELNEQDYFKALPFIYAFGIKLFVKNRFDKRAAPDWYENDAELKGALL